MKQESESIKEQLANVLYLPKDLILGKSLLSGIGRNEFYLENFLAISEFDSGRLRIRTKNGFITFLGQRIRINYYRKDELKISGLIEMIIFE